MTSTTTGLPEIVSSIGDYQNGHVIVFEHDGTHKWTSSTLQPWMNGAAPALADLDNDGDTEIIVSGHVYDHDGNLEWFDSTGTGSISASTAADLDGDGDLEVITGLRAYHHDGSQYYSVNGGSYAFPQVADLDDDPEPEVLLVTIDGITVLEHTGGVKYFTPSRSGPTAGCALQPSTTWTATARPRLRPLRSRPTGYSRPTSAAPTGLSIQDGGFASGTAFDFLGQGLAQAM